MDNKRELHNNLAFVVEDDHDIADLYAQVVREAGYIVEVFYDGKAATKRRKTLRKTWLLDMHLIDDWE
jgi:DNA-binding response OmpR family regulator